MSYLLHKFVGAKFLESGDLLSDSYTSIRTLTRLTIYMYYSRLLVYDIVNLVTVSLLNVLVIGAHRLCLRNCTYTLEFVMIVTNTLRRETVTKT